MRLARSQPPLYRARYGGEYKVKTSRPSKKRFVRWARNAGPCQISSPAADHAPQTSRPALPPPSPRLHAAPPPARATGVDSRLDARLGRFAAASPVGAAPAGPSPKLDPNAIRCAVRDQEPPPSPRSTSRGHGHNDQMRPTAFGVCVRSIDARIGGPNRAGVPHGPRALTHVFSDRRDHPVAASLGDPH